MVRIGSEGPQQGFASLPAAAPFPRNKKKLLLLALGATCTAAQRYLISGPSNLPSPLVPPSYDLSPAARRLTACVPDGNTTLVARGTQGYLPWFDTDVGVQAVDSGWFWRMAHVDSCNGVVAWEHAMRPVVLTYTFAFDEKNFTERYRYKADAIVMMPSETQQDVRDFMSEREKRYGVKFVEVQDAASAGTVFCLGSNMRDSTNRPLGGFATSPQEPHGVVMLSVGYNVKRDGIAALAHEFGHRFGGEKHTFDDEGRRPVLLSYPRPFEFKDWEFSSVMSYTAAKGTCDLRVTGTGPLDDGLFLLRYGPGTLGSGDDVYRLTQQSGIKSLPADSEGHNSVVAEHDDTVLLNLDSGANDATKVGPSRVRVAPGSRFYDGDISPTKGGTLVGNFLGNRLNGSAYDDVIVPRDGNDTVTTGDGTDHVVVQAGPGRIIITDFSTEKDALITVFVKGDVNITDTPEGALVTFVANGKEVLLAGVSARAFDAQKHVSENPAFKLPSIDKIYECDPIEPWWKWFNWQNARIMAVGAVGIFSAARCIYCCARRVSKS